MAPPSAILLVDGIFLHRDELAGRWDFSMFLDVDFATSFARMAVRDGSPSDPDDPRNRRYVEGQRLYLAQCDPASRASLVIDNRECGSGTQPQGVAVVLLSTVIDRDPSGREG